jgi:hypothetical protein
VLRYTPEQFRAMTPGEFNLAVDGIAIANGTYKKKPTMTWNDVLDMEAALWQRQ